MPPEITVDRLRSLFVVDLEAGRLFWREAPRTHPRLKGKEAGSVRAGRKPYWIVKIDGRPVRRAHIVFALAHGRFASPLVDHINGDGLDDRAGNLREATVLENAWNHKTRRKASGLPMGVRQMPTSGRFQARIACRHRTFHLGTFATAGEALAAYQAKRREMFGEFA